MNWYDFGTTSQAIPRNFWADGLGYNTGLEVNYASGL